MREARGKEGQEATVSILAGVVVLAVLLGLAAYLTGLVLAVRLLAQGAAGRAGPIEPQLGALLLVGIGGLLVETTLVASGLVADAQTDLIRLRGTRVILETRVHIYETGLARLKRTVEAGQRAGASGDRLAADLRQQLRDLRRRASLP